MSPIINPNTTAGPAKPPTDPMDRKPTRLEARTVSPTIAGFTAVASVRLSSGTRGLPDKTIQFYYGGSNEFAGTAQTDDDGVANYDPGNQIAGVLNHALQAWVSGGYVAKFNGDDWYQGCSAHGRVTLLPGILPG